MALSRQNSRTFGVESTNTTFEAEEHALNLARQYECTIAVSGPIDFITDGVRQVRVPYGAELMPLVTGMGCTLGAIIAAFRAVESNSFEASRLAIQYYGLCGELAASHACHPGTFYTAFIDALYSPNFEN